MTNALEARDASPVIVVVRRMIAATPDELFDAWINPQALALWMRPRGIRHTTAKADVRIGGSYEIVMQGDDATHPHHGIYRVIDRPRRLAFTWVSNATKSCETLVTVDFMPSGDRTEVVVTHERLPHGAHESHIEGWTTALERLADPHERAHAP